MFEAAAKIAKQFDLKDGFRIVNNCGDCAGPVSYTHLDVYKRQP